MNTYVLTADDKLQEELRRHYEKYIEASKNPYMKYFIRANDFNVSIYSSGKVVFQGKEALREFSNWQEVPLSFFEKPSELTSEPIVSSDYIGSDEVGTGDVFGPVCVCACYLDDQAILAVEKLNILDSKKLNDIYISKIAPYLMEKLKYELIILNNNEYNNLIASGKNLVAIKAYTHNLAIAKLLSRVASDTKVVVDQFVNEKSYYKYLQNEPVIVKDVHLETKAESKYLAVALASIIARYAFVKEMEKLSFQVGFTIPKGARSEADEALMRVVELYGENVLNDIAKIHFTNVQKLLNNNEDK